MHFIWNTCYLVETMFLGYAHQKWVWQHSLLFFFHFLNVHFAMSLFAGKKSIFTLLLAFGPRVVAAGAFLSSLKYRWTALRPEFFGWHLRKINFFLDFNTPIFKQSRPKWRHHLGYSYFLLDVQIISNSR